jgi:hypothetical protein
VSPITLEGRARSVNGTCPALTFTVDGRTVYTTSATDYKKGKCSDLTKGGEDVEVKGTLMSDKRVRADRVTFDKDDN